MEKLATRKEGQNLLDSSTIYTMVSREKSQRQSGMATSDAASYIMRMFNKD